MFGTTWNLGALCESGRHHPKALRMVTVKIHQLKCAPASLLIPRLRIRNGWGAGWSALLMTATAPRRSVQTSLICIAAKSNSNSTNCSIAVSSQPKLARGLCQLDRDCLSPTALQSQSWNPQHPPQAVSWPPMTDLACQSRKNTSTQSSRALPTPPNIDR